MTQSLITSPRGASRLGGLCPVTSGPWAGSWLAYRYGTDDFVRLSLPPGGGEAELLERLGPVLRDPSQHRRLDGLSPFPLPPSVLAKTYELRGLCWDHDRARLWVSMTITYAAKDTWGRRGGAPVLCSLEWMPCGPPVVRGPWRYDDTHCVCGSQVVGVVGTDLLLTEWNHSGFQSGSWGPSLTLGRNPQDTDPAVVPYTPPHEWPDPLPLTRLIHWDAITVRAVDEAGIPINSPNFGSYPRPVRLLPDEGDRVIVSTDPALPQGWSYVVADGGMYDRSRVYWVEPDGTAYPPPGPLGAASTHRAWEQDLSAVGTLTHSGTGLVVRDGRPVILQVGMVAIGAEWYGAAGEYSVPSGDGDAPVPILSRWHLRRDPYAHETSFRIRRCHGAGQKGTHVEARAPLLLAYDLDSVLGPPRRWTRSSTSPRLVADETELLRDLDAPVAELERGNGGYLDPDGTDGGIVGGQSECTGLHQMDGRIYAYWDQAVRGGGLISVWEG